MSMQRSLRAPAARAALGALTIASTTMSAAPAAGQSAKENDSDPTARLAASLRDDAVRYGERVVLTGRAGGSGGAGVALEFRARGTSAWVPVAQAQTTPSGRYRLAVALSRSGAVRVATATTSTRAHAVRVAGRLSVATRRLNVLPGRGALVAGALRRPHAGRVVTLQRRGEHGWSTIARDRTDAQGRYRLRDQPRPGTSGVVRVRFGGDAANAGVRRRVGRLNAFRRTFASWFGPGFYGSRTACGQTFSAGIMGVAHKSLPCGTQVVLRRGDRIVQARVVDRGPFAAGREFDLSPAVKQRLGFGSTGPLWVAV